MYVYFTIITYKYNNYLDAQGIKLLSLLSYLENVFHIIAHNNTDQIEITDLKKIIQFSKIIKCMYNES